MTRKINECINKKQNKQTRQKKSDDDNGNGRRSHNLNVIINGVHTQQQKQKRELVHQFLELFESIPIKTPTYEPI